MQQGQQARRKQAGMRCVHAVGIGVRGDVETSRAKAARRSGT